MSIASEIARLQTAKSDLKTAIENKGVTVPSATKLDGYASLVDQISGGSSGGTVTLVSLMPDGNETITYTGTESGTVNITNGIGSVALPTGTYTFTSSDTVWNSGTVGINANTTINCWYGTPVYWYGNICDSGSFDKSNSTMTLNMGTNSFTVGSGTGGTIRYAYTNNSYDLTNYNSVNGVVQYYSSSRKSYIAYGTVKSSNSSNAIQYAETTNNTVQTLTISLTSHPQTAYIYVGNDASAGYPTTCWALWLT